MTKTKLKKIMESRAEVWVICPDFDGHETFQSASEDDSNDKIVFKIVEDETIKVTYAVFSVNGDADIIFPNTPAQQKMLDEFVEFVAELRADLEEISEDDLSE